MELNPSIFPKLIVGAFGLVILGFFVRGFSSVAVGSEMAELLAAPIFILAFLAAVAGFVLSVCIKIGVIRTSLSDA